MSFEYDVFLSYSTKDAEIVHPLAERLKSDGVKVWLDKWSIDPGAMIGLEIQRGLENSRTLVMCMSPDYFESEWGKLEHHSACCSAIPPMPKDDFSHCSSSNARPPTSSHNSHTLIGGQDGEADYESLCWALADSIEAGNSRGGLRSQ